MQRRMQTRTLQKKSGRLPRNTVAVADVPSLVRRLVEQVTANNLADGPSRDSSGVILDVQVDGVRCVLFQYHRNRAHSTVTLSPRECEIARMVAQGYPNKTIAAVLEISSWTVGTYLR